MKHTYRLISFDVWGNENDGWDVNDAHYTGINIELDEDCTDKDIVKALKKCGYLKKTLKTKSVRFDGDDYCIYFSDARNSKPEGELRRYEIVKTPIDDPDGEMPLIKE
jgi:hypothetical protein